MILHGDCLERLREIESASVDMVLADLPYGTTACKWDTVIPFEPLWKELHRVAKPNAAMCFFGSEPFSSALRMSNIKQFRYDWVWQKAVGSNFANLKHQPMKEHETISVFSSATHRYYPIRQPRKGSGASRARYAHNDSSTCEVNGLQKKHFNRFFDPDSRNPSSVQFFNNREPSRGLHPTQKPVALLEYLIRTYTNEGDLVLDPTCGSGSAGVAALKTGRRFVGIEQDASYVEIATRRMEGVV